MKAIIAIVSVLVFGFCGWICWIALQKHETWVAPEISGTVMQLEGEGLPIVGVEVTAENSETEVRRAVTDEMGRFRFPAVLQMKRGGLPGDRCFWTTVSVVDTAGRKLDYRAGVCSGELSGRRPSKKVSLTFRLAEVGSDQFSTVDDGWRKGTGRVDGM